MKCNILATNSFSRVAKKLFKKYVSLKIELKELESQLIKNPRLGIKIHENIYKIRIAVKSKGKGKSGGLSVITFLTEIKNEQDLDENDQDITVYLLTIYDKSNIENISEKELKNIIKEIESELDSE